MLNKNAGTVYEGTLDAKGLKFGIVCGRFNDFFVSRLLSGAIDAIVRHGGCADDVANRSHNRTANGAEHKAQGARDHEKGHDEVHGGEGGLAYEIGDEVAVHHAVNGGEDHHDNGGQGKEKQLFIGEMIGKLDFHRAPLFIRE